MCPSSMALGLAVAGSNYYCHTIGLRPVATMTTTTTTAHSRPLQHHQHCRLPAFSKSSRKGTHRGAGLSEGLSVVCKANKREYATSSMALGLAVAGSNYCHTIGLRPVATMTTTTTAHSRPLQHHHHCRLPTFSKSSRNGTHRSVVCKANKREYATERSDKANEELLMFFFQLDLTTRLQRALNQDMYEAAQGLREKIAEVEREMKRQQREKTGGSGGGSSSSSSSLEQDTAITLLQTKAKLQRLVEEEDYEAAGAVRRQIVALEAESLAAQANAMIYQQQLCSFVFRLGQKVTHRVHGYRGVVCGMDPLCCESEEWARAAGLGKLSRGRNQPFYQILVDIREEPSVMVTYVAEENLVAPEEPDFDQFDHPYVYFLFYGMDGAGDFIACKQLREKYDAARHELPYDDKEGD